LAKNKKTGLFPWQKSANIGFFHWQKLGEKGLFPWQKTHIIIVICKARYKTVTDVLGIPAKTVCFYSK